MKIVVAPQAFKGTLSAPEVAECFFEGIHRVFVDAEVLMFPIADGGDGTLDILLNLFKGERKTRGVSSCSFSESMRLRTVEVQWGTLFGGKTAVIEMACICGLSMTPVEERNPLRTTTFGLGELIGHALDLGFRDFILGVGGTATNDGGVGMIQALGGRFLDEVGNPLPLGLESLIRLAHIDLSLLDHRLKQSRFTVLCDVTNPLIGANGATMIYGRQKGASVDTLPRIEKIIEHLANIVKKQLNCDLAHLSFGGAGGGAAAGIFAFIKGKLCSGIDFILDCSHFNDRLGGADLLLTGEGCLDGQTLFNKGPFAVAKRALQFNVPTLAIVGSLGNGYDQVLNHGVAAAIPLTFIEYPTPSCSKKQLKESVTNATEQTLRCLAIGGNWRGSTRPV